MSEVHEHLRHMTDGRWHDECSWCRRRRVWGGDGTALPLRAGRRWRELWARGVRTHDPALYAGYMP